MTGGAILLLCTGELSLPDAVAAINGEVMIFLFGMFLIGEAVAAGGYLSAIAETICRIAMTKDQLLILLIGGFAVSSAVLMNDTVAVIGTPLVLSVASRYRVPPVPALLVLCFSLTTGSVMSPVGNPQNLLIATFWDPVNPFLAFAGGLVVPTVISLGLVYLLMRGRCRRDADEVPSPPLPTRSDRRLEVATALSLLLLSLFILMRIAGSLLGGYGEIPLGYIALISALPVLILARQRVSLVRGIDWRTLIFFASMFILMQGVYNSGWFQGSVPFQDLTSVPALFALSLVLSQFISNVPFIALFEPVIAASGLSPGGMLSLAAGSTIAGNLTILGAASNVIVAQQAEKAGITLTFRDFLRAGVPLTILQALVYMIWLIFLPS